MSLLEDSLGDAAAIRRIRGHVARRLRDAKIELLPFPHAVIGDFLPPEIFEQALGFNLFKWGEGRPWFSTPRDQGVLEGQTNSTTYGKRSQIHLLKRDAAFDGPPEALQFWRTLSRAFHGANWLPRSIYQKFPAIFALRYGENVLRRDFWAQTRSVMFVQRHEPGYSLGPHTDRPGRIFTCLFSLADRPGFEACGTDFVRPLAPYASGDGSNHFPFSDFETVTTAPYAPNGFVVFFRTPTSFHCVRELPEDVCNQRFGMQFQFHEPGRGLMRDLEDAPPTHGPDLPRLEA